MLLILATADHLPPDLLAEMVEHGDAVLELPAAASPTLAAGLLLALAPEPCRALTVEALRRRDVLEVAA